MDVPSGWTVVDRHQVGPFTTSMVLQPPDGEKVVFTAWRHRKGHGLAAAGSVDRVRAIEWWAPQRRGWWIAILFMVGSLCFALGSLPPIAAALGQAVTWVFFIGSILFLVASAFAVLEVRDGFDHGRRPSLETAIAWINMVGSIAFGISAIAAFIDPANGELLNVAAANAFTFIGAVLFFSGALMLLPDMGRSAEEETASA